MSITQTTPTTTTRDCAAGAPGPGRGRPRVAGAITIVLAVLAAVLALTGPSPAAAQSAPSVSASPDPAAAGSVVTVSGGGFQPGEMIDVGFAGGSVSTTADAQGDYSVSLTVDPLVPAGAHPLDASGDQGSWAGSDLTIAAPAPAPAPAATVPPLNPPAASVPSVAVHPDPAAAGSAVTVSGGGFLPGEMIDVGFAGTIVTTNADATGDYAVSLTVDSLVPAGAHPLDVVGHMGSWAGTDLTITPAAPSPAPAPAPAPAPVSAPAPASAPAAGPAPAPASAPSRPSATPGPSSTPTPSSPVQAPLDPPSSPTADEAVVVDAARDADESVPEVEQTASDEDGVIEATTQVGESTASEQPTETERSERPATEVVAVPVVADSDDSDGNSIRRLLPMIFVVVGLLALLGAVVAERQRRTGRPAGV